MTTPRHPDSGQFTPPAALTLADAVNLHLAGRPGAPYPPVPSVPDHGEAMSTGSDAGPDLPAAPDTGSESQAGDMKYAR